MMEVSLYQFSEGTLQTVKCSCLDEKVANGCEHRAVTVQGSKKRQINTASTSHQEDKTRTRNKVERHGAIRTRPLFLMPYTRAQR